MAEDVRVILGVDPATESNVQGWFSGKEFKVKLTPEGEFAKQLEASLQKAQENASKKAAESSAKSMATAQQKASDGWAKQQAKQIQQLAKEQARALSDAQKQALSATNGKTLSNNMANWLKENTQYTEKYGAAINDLQRRLSEAIKAGDSAAIKQIGAEFRELQSEAKLTSTTVSDMGKALKQALGGTVLGGLAKAGVALAARELRRAAREMVESAIEIESALAQLQVVTGASGSQLDTFFERSAESAKQLGVEVKDMLGSVETFSRLGYSLNESLDLSKWATVLGNIADMDVSSATTGITSILKGWGKDVSEAEHIADVISIIGKNYAISSEEIVTASERSGAALMAAGTSMEKSMALFAAANASVQNAQVVG